MTKKQKARYGGKSGQNIKVTTARKPCNIGIINPAAHFRPSKRALPAITTSERH
ncbi:MAG: hypothetical protein ACJARL_002912 [Halopseudomonas sp.]|jgi:hypothetical protein